MRSAGIGELARDGVRVIDSPGERHGRIRQINCLVFAFGTTEETVGASGAHIKTHNLAALIDASRNSVGATGRVDGDEGALGVEDEPMTHVVSVHIVADDFPMGVDAEQTRDGRSRKVDCGKDSVTQKKAVSRFGRTRYRTVIVLAD